MTCPEQKIQFHRGMGSEEGLNLETEVQRCPSSMHISTSPPPQSAPTVHLPVSPLPVRFRWSRHVPGAVLCMKSLCVFAQAYRVAGHSLLLWALDHPSDREKATGRQKEETSLAVS